MKNRQRIIMSINPGRSGSNYLAALLNTAKNVSAYHEPSPTMAGRYVKLFPAEKSSIKALLLYYPIYFKKLTKVREIKRTLNLLSPDVSYAETSHMFILSFYDVVMKYFPEVEVVHLRRYMPKVLKSYIETNNFAPGFHDIEKAIKKAASGEINQTKFWCVSPNSQSAAAKAIAKDTEMDQIDQCIAYLIDIEARAQRFKLHYPHVKVIEVHLESLNNTAAVYGFFEDLGAEISPDTEKYVGKARNKKLSMKKELGITISEDFCYERIIQYIEKCKIAGISLPPLPHLNCKRQ